MTKVSQQAYVKVESTLWFSVNFASRGGRECKECVGKPILENSSSVLKPALQICLLGNTKSWGLNIEH